VIVLDASAVVELLLGTLGAEAVGRHVACARSLHAPSLLDLEVAQSIRRFCATGQLCAECGDQAIAELADLPVARIGLV